MNNAPRPEDPRERTWRALTPAQAAELQAWLQAHPESGDDLLLDLNLTRALDSIPEVPVPSNFTSRVMGEVERESRLRERRGAWQRPLWLRWLPRVALAVLVVGGSALTYHRYEVAQHRKMVRSLELVSHVSSLPSPEILQDFEAIRALDQPLQADEELLTLMQ